MLKTLKIRHKITENIRNFLNKNSFLNIETPILSKSTPEGARDYLISSRLYSNRYYALPQSPQIFKQLLMISGIDKYYQIIKCFRDEDLRSDRQPEFTQIDIEAAFINDVYIKKITESIIKLLWKKFLNYDLHKIPTIKFNDAINKYGSDKPDLRNPIKLHHIKKNIFLYNNNHINLKSIKTVGIVIPKGIIKLTLQKINSFNIILNKYNIYYFYIYIYNIDKNQYSIKNSINLLKENNMMEIINLLCANDNDIILILSGKIDIIYKIFQNLRTVIAKELNIINYNSWKPVWITDFPMFTKDKNNNLTTMHHPFTSPKNIDSININDQNITSIIANSYDLVINGYELGGGSVRIHNPKIQKKIFEILGISKKNKEYPLQFFINALKYGTPPHAGIALGLDRIVMLLTKNTNIKDVIAFPKTNTATCLMTGAPSKII